MTVPIDNSPVIYEDPDVEVEGAKQSSFIRVKRQLRSTWMPFTATLVLSIAVIVLFATLANVTDQVLKAFILQQGEERVQAFLGRFLTSPGFGGVSAVLAAGITALVIAAQLLYTRRKDRESTWWDRYEWITERTFPSRKDDSNPVPRLFAINFLRKLSTEAKTPLQGHACESFIDEILPEDLCQFSEGEPSGDSSIDGIAAPSAVARAVGDQTEGPREWPMPSPAAPSVAAFTVAGANLVSDILKRNGGLSAREIRATSDYVESTRGTASSSSKAEVYVFRHYIKDALEYGGQDFKLWSNESDVIELRFTSKIRAYLVALPDDPEKYESRIKELTKLRKPVLAVSPGRGKPFLRRGTAKIYRTTWHPSMGNDVLMGVVREFEILLREQHLRENNQL